MAEIGISSIWKRSVDARGRYRKQQKEKAIMKQIRWMMAAAILMASLMAIAATQMEASTVDEKVLRHVVMFQFKEGTSEKQIQTIVDAFRGLPGKIPEIRAFEYGVNNSPEGLADGLTHCFLVTFHSEKDRDAYLPHAAHKAFVDVLKPHLQKAVVLDYWSSK